MGSNFLNMNRGKRSIAIDLKHPESRPVMARLVGGADVFIHHVLTPQRKEELRGGGGPGHPEDVRHGREIGGEPAVDGESHGRLADHREMIPVNAPGEEASGPVARHADDKNRIPRAELISVITGQYLR